jgi:hypothetical protein
MLRKATPDVEGGLSSSESLGGSSVQPDQERLSRFEKFLSLGP